MPLELVDPLLPWILPGNIAGIVNGTLMGRGRLYWVVQAAANTDITIATSLGRVPQFIRPIYNGTNFVPRWKLSAATPPALNTITVQFDATAPSPGCLVWVL